MRLGYTLRSGFKPIGALDLALCGKQHAFDIKKASLAQRLKHIRCSPQKTILMHGLKFTKLLSQLR